MIKVLERLPSLTRGELAAALDAEGFNGSVHASSLYRGFYRRLSQRPWLDVSLPRALRESEAQALPESRLIEKHGSGLDASTKLLLELADGERIEAVIIPESRRMTLCVSTQVGCAQSCVFCHTARMGLRRQLSAAEIVDQVRVATRWLRDETGETNREIGNLVFMGMGEPLDNVDSLLVALEILTDPHGLGLAARRLTVSTAGHLEGLDRLLTQRPSINLALSLHAVDPIERARIMPIEKANPLSEFKARMMRHQSENPGQLFVQYTLFDGINDSLAHARRLSAWCEGLRVKLNLIPFNDIGLARFARPPAGRLQGFRDALFADGLRVMVRESKGRDIAAACGQLVHRKAAKTSSAQPPSSGALAAGSVGERSSSRSSR